MSELLRQPAEERIENTNVYHFMEYVNARHLMSFANYGELYGWSIEESPVFWETLCLQRGHPQPILRSEGGLRWG